MQFLFGHRFLQRHLKSSIWRQLKHGQHNSAKVILLPEVPADTGETNAFLRCIENQKLPEIGAWPFRDAVSGVAKLGLEYEGWLLEHFEAIEPDQASSSFSSVMDPLESRSVPVDFAWFTLSQYFASMYFGNANAESHVHGLSKMMTRLVVNRYTSPEFYKVLKGLQAKKSLNAWEKRSIEHDLLECHYNGMDLKPHKTAQLIDAREFYAKRRQEYQEHIMNSSVKLRTREVEESSDLLDAPEYVLRLLANQPEGSISFPISVAYSPRRFAHYLQYCRKRGYRWSWWHQVNSRAAFNEDSALFNNSSLVEDLRGIREREAKFLGYKTFADCQLRMCMANSVGEVNEFLTKFGEKASDKLDALYEDMCSMADAEGVNTKKEPPNAYDLTYYARKVANEKFKLDHHRFAEYFPYQQTLKNMLAELGKLFGIKFSDVSENVPRWNPGVQAIEVRQEQKGDLIGYLFIDPYSRNGKTLANFAMPGRPSSDIVKSNPIAYLNFNLTPPSEDKPSLIYLDQLANFAFQLGRSLQYILSAAPYSSMQGDNLIEFDCKHVVARVMELLIASRPKFLVNISHHYQNGEKVDLGTAERHVRGRVALELPTIVREVVDSELDMAMYSTRNFWRDVYRDLHAKYLPYKFDARKGDDFVCNIGGYVTENLASKYFSVLWNKKLASDIAEAFEEVTDSEDAVAEVGKRFTDVYLAENGMRSQAEAFKKFRGRDPTLEPMIKFYASF